MTEWKGGGTAWKNVAGREKIISGIVMFMAWAHSHPRNWRGEEILKIPLGDVRVRTGESEWEKWETFEEGHFGKIRNRQAVKALKKIVVWTDKSARARKVRGTVNVIEDIIKGRGGN
jgi:hypothetical protein